MATPPLTSRHSGGDIAASVAGLWPDLAALCGPEINEDTLAKTICELLRLGLADWPEESTLDLDSILGESVKLPPSRPKRSGLT